MRHIRLMPVLFLLACASAAAADVELSVLSSAPDMVTGGDARIAVKAAPALQDGMIFWLNGARIAPPMVRTADDAVGLTFSITAEAYELWRNWFASREVPLDRETKWIHGGKSLYVCDPDGRRIEFKTPGMIVPPKLEPLKPKKSDD